MKRRSFLKLTCLTVASLAINPVSTIKSISDVGVTDTWVETRNKSRDELLQQHAIEMERMFLYGRPFSEPNKIGGVIKFIRDQDNSKIEQSNPP